MHRRRVGGTLRRAGPIPPPAQPCCWCPRLEVLLGSASRGRTPLHDRGSWTLSSRSTSSTRASSARVPPERQGWQEKTGTFPSTRNSCRTLLRRVRFALKEEYPCFFLYPCLPRAGIVPFRYDFRGMVQEGGGPKRGDGASRRPLERPLGGEGAGRRPLERPLGGEGAGRRPCEGPLGGEVAGRDARVASSRDLRANPDARPHCSQPSRASRTPPATPDDPRAYTPDDPNPPEPRSLSLRLSASSHSTSSTRAITNWAMRSPGWTVNGSRPRFTNSTPTSPR